MYAFAIPSVAGTILKASNKYLLRIEEIARSLRAKSETMP
jgi:hypothetical protein